MLTYLVAIFAFTVELEVSAHFSSELMHIWSAWSEHHFLIGQLIANTLKKLFETGVTIFILFLINGALFQTAAILN